MLWTGSRELMSIVFSAGGWGGYSNWGGGYSNGEGPYSNGEEEVKHLMDRGSTRFGSPFSSKIVVHGHCLVTLLTQLMKH